MPFAVNGGSIARPLALVVAVSVFNPPVNVPLAPLAGAVNVTVTPLTGLPLASLTVAAMAVPKPVFSAELCGVPAVAVIVSVPPPPEDTNGKAPISGAVP